jgi:hypothetical protein
MNRHERRKKRAQERKARRSGDTMGSAYQTGPLPESVRNHPAFKAGEKAAKDGLGLPPGYHEDIEQAAALIVEWHAQQVDPDLRWLAMDRDRTFIAAALDTGASYLADSPDAFRLLAWLDEKTGRKLSINQAMWALRRCRAMPMPDGSFLGTETIQESAGMKMLKTFADGTGTDTRVKPSPCGHCGEMLDGASAGPGAVPGPGDLTMCIKCGGFNRFDDEMLLAKVTDEDIDELDDAGTRTQLRDAQALLRHYRAQSEMGGKSSKAPAEA